MHLTSKNFGCNIILYTETFSEMQNLSKHNETNTHIDYLLISEKKGENVLATLKDIAKIANMNISTVSRAINGSTDINPDTREKIIKIAQELNYNVIKTKKMLPESSSKTIGIITPEIVCGCYAQIVDSIEEKLTSEGYTIIIGCTGFKSSEELRMMQSFAHKEVEGIILIRSLDKSITDELIKFKKLFNIPLVQVDMEYTIDVYDCIRFDDLAGISIAINYLIELGHKSIGFIGDYKSIRRKEKFESIMDNYGLHINKDYIKVGEQRFEKGGYLRMKEILTNEELPTAIIASYDLIAIGAMKAIYGSGLNIPKDISIIGIDNISITDYLEKALTTISVPYNDVGELASKIIIRKIKNKEYKVIQHVELKPELLVRDTTCRCNK